MKKLPLSLDVAPFENLLWKTNASIHLWLGPGSRPINIQNRTGSMCFIRFIVIPDNRTNDVVCTRVKKLYVIKTFLMRPNVQGPPASSQIKQYDLVNYQIIVKPNFSQQTNLQRCSMRPWWCFQSLKHIWYLPVYSVSAPSPPEYIKLTTGTSLRKAIFLFLSCGQLPVSDRWTFNKTFKNDQKLRLKFFWIFF